MPTSSQTPAGLTVGDGYVIVNPGSAEQVGDSTFYPTGPISDDTLVVIPDAQGNLPGGLTKATLKSAVAQLHSQGTVTSSLGVDVAGAATSAAPSATTPSAQPDAVAAGTYYSWSATSAGYSRSYVGGTIIGADWSATARYNFDAADGFTGFAVGLGKGHYRGYNGSTFGTWTTYYGVGNSDGPGAFVPWGEVLDNEGFEAQCAQSTICWGSFWDF